MTRSAGIPSTGAVRVALLGYGRIAELFHLRILARLRGVEVGFVAEDDPDRREAARALLPEASLVADYRRVVEDATIDAVVICLPTGLHAEVACAAFRAGKHVYVEKPIATTLVDGRLIREAWRSSGTVGMTGFNQRFEPVIHEFKRAMAAGRVGTVVGARATSGAVARTLPAWKCSRATGGGVLLDLASHAVDLVRFLFEQEIRSVSATVASARTEDDTASLAMTLIDGRIVNAHLTLAGIQESRFEIFGDQGRLVVDRYAGTLEFEPPRPPYGRMERLRRGVGRLGALPRELGDFVRPPKTSVPTGQRSRRSWAP